MLFSLILAHYKHTEASQITPLSPSHSCFLHVGGFNSDKVYDYTTNDGVWNYQVSKKSSHNIITDKQ
jgi:hypothetical protein